MKLVCSKCLIIISLIPMVLATCTNERLKYDWEPESSQPVIIRVNDLTLLTAEDAEYSQEMTINKAVTGIGNWSRPDQWFRWQVQADKKADYEVILLIEGKENDRIKVLGPINSVMCELERNGWDKQVCQGLLSLPKGISEIEAKLENVTEASLFSLEVLDVNEKEAIAKRVRQFRSSTDWLRDRTYGIFFQWGYWGYPKQGEPKANWKDVYRDFNIERWANMMEEMGTGWVVWSITWGRQHLAAPIAAYEDIHAGFTMEYDFLGKLAEELSKRNIKLIFYYHPGHGEDNWWRVYAGAKDGQPDRNVWFPNFIKVVSEIGNRYGEKLHGWMFDGGRKYYPAPYEQLGRAAKSGYPERLVSWNPWILPRVTEYQDFYFGEHWHGNEYRWEIGPLGRFITGPQRGLQAHGNYPLAKSGWGIKGQNRHTKEPPFTPETWLEYLREIQTRNAAISPAVLMYQDGEIHPVTYQIFVHARREFLGISDDDLKEIRLKRGDPPTVDSYHWDD